MGSTTVFWDRFFKLSVLIAIPLLGWVYFDQHKNVSKAEVIVPFKVDKAPSIAGLQARAEAHVDFSRNKVSVVSFWATWCAPCVEEMPAMSELAARLESKGVKFYFVSIDDDWAKVDRFLEANIIDVPADRLFLDSKREVAARWGSEKFPETYIISPDGWMVEKVIGFQDWTRPSVFSYFESLAGKYTVAMGSNPILSKLQKLALLTLPFGVAHADDKNTAAPLIHEDDKKALKKIQQNVETANKNVQKLEAAIKDEERSVREMKIKIERQTKDQGDVQGQLDKIRDSLNEVEKVRKKNDDSLSAEKSEKDRVAKDLANLQQKQKDLEKELERTRDNIVLTNQKMSTRMQNIESFDKALASSREEIKSLQDREKKLASNVKDQGKDIGDMQRDYSKRESKVSALQVDLAKWNDTLNKEKQKLVEFEKLLK